MRILLALLVSGCFDQPEAPLVRVTGETDSWIIKGAQAWGTLGFDVVTEETGLEECPRYWHHEPRVTDCVITILVVNDPTISQEFPGIGGLSSVVKRKIWLDSKVWKGSFFGRVSLSAHEFGHILLDFPSHIEGRHIMDTGHPTMSPSMGDRMVACEYVGLCTRGLGPE